MLVNRQRLLSFLLGKYAVNELSTADVLRWNGRQFVPGRSLPTDSFIQVEAWSLAFTEYSLDGFVTFDSATLQSGNDLSWSGNAVSIDTAGIYAAACLFERQDGVDAFTVGLVHAGDSFNPSQTVAAETTDTGLTLLPVMMPAGGTIQLEVNAVGDVTLTVYLYVVRLA